jgi:phospholipid transport system substrate-binding protein
MHRSPLLFFAAALSILLGAPVARAQAGDPAAAQITALHGALLDVMRRAKVLGPKGRYEALRPPIEQAFDLPTMARFAVGTTWSGLPPDQQAMLVKAFTRMTVATYAHNFDGFNGETFSLEKVDTRGPDKLVHTRLHSGGTTTDLTYRMRQSAGTGTWKVIDVYYNSTVSSLLGQRSEFATTLAAGGATALAKSLEHRADVLLQGP